MCVHLNVNIVITAVKLKLVKNYTIMFIQMNIILSVTNVIRVSKQKIICRITYCMFIHRNINLNATNVTHVIKKR